jgi:plasmid stabilization system protein ParE
LANLDAIRAYVAQFNPSAAGSPAANLMAAGNSLAHFPHRGGPVPKTGMRELVTAFPYIIRYQIFGDEVVILRVRHTARRPSRP